ncbi:hypothetical protein Ddc_19429 [Ditylenchus destructor]|nr:hypothetical protein Ddc_19429 [Ditylenchus destructor]
MYKCIVIALLFVVLVNAAKPKGMPPGFDKLPAEVQEKIMKVINKHPNPEKDKAKIKTEVGKILKAAGIKPPK